MCWLVSPHPLDIPLHAVVAELPFSVLAVYQVLQRVFAELKVLGKLGAVVSPCPTARNVDSECGATHDGAPSVNYQPPLDSVISMRRGVSRIMWLQDLNRWHIRAFLGPPRQLAFKPLVEVLRSTKPPHEQNGLGAIRSEQYCFHGNKDIRPKLAVLADPAAARSYRSGPARAG